MRRSVCVAALSLLAIACATPDAIPYCPDGDAALPEATAECRSEPEVMDRSARLADLIVPGMESLLVRVEFDENSRVRSICGARGPGSKQWSDRVRVAERRAEILALPAGPACVANSRLEFNRLGLRLAEVGEILRDCSRQSSTPAQVRTCWDRFQSQRNEIWVFDPIHLDPLIFVATPDSVSRRKAIRECADMNARIGRSTFDATIAGARTDQRVVDCMRTHGWKLFE